MKEKIGLFWGSDTGIIEELATIICDKLGAERVDSYSVFDVSPLKFQAYNKIIIGLSTWYDGQLQSDWDEFFEEFQEIPFNHATVAFFGAGDQEGYGEYFVDGIGTLADVVLKNGGKIVGKWPTKGYDFSASKAVKEKGYFLGLAIDEDNQPHLTDARLQEWLKQLNEEGFL